MLAFSFILLLPILAVAKPFVHAPAPAFLVTERYLLQRQDECSSCTAFTTAAQNCVASDPTGAQPSTIACICSSATLDPITPCFSCLGSSGGTISTALQSSVDQLVSTCRDAGYQVPDVSLGGSSSIAVASSSAQASSQEVSSSSAAAQASSSTAGLSASAVASSTSAARVSPSVRTTSIPASASATSSTGSGERRVKEGGLAMLFLGVAAVGLLI